MDCVIKVEKLSKSFRKVLFQDVNLSINSGNIVVLVGENGSGKSVFYKILCGLEKPTTGQVYIRGKQMGKYEIPKGVGFLINSPGYIGEYTGFQNLKFLATIRNQISDETIREAMEFVGLDSCSQEKTKHYSMGMKQKLGIAQAIMEGQDILFLDEPFNGLDFDSKNEIVTIISNLKKQGKTILLTSHLFEDLLLCDQIYLLSDKRIVECSKEEIEKKYQIV